MTEEECLAAIASGEDADTLLIRAMPDARRKFNAVDRAMLKLLDAVRQHFPDAQYYTASGGFHLMLGKSHEYRPGDFNMKGQQQLIALSGNARIGDGDF